jgi:hypothetical protein
VHLPSLEDDGMVEWWKWGALFLVQLHKQDE